MTIKKLGLGINAFSDDARRTVDRLVTNEDKADDLIYYVESEGMVLIQGPKNSGKTRLAMEVIDRFKGEGKVIYIDLDKYKKELDIGHLLVGNQGFLRRFFNRMPKDFILIVDNAINLDTDFYRRIQYFYDQGYLKSVIFIKNSYHELVLPNSMASRIGNKVINLKGLKKEDCLKIASNRLGKFFNEKHLNNIWNLSGDLSTFLGNCEKVAYHYIEEERKRLDVNFINRVLKK